MTQKRSQSLLVLAALGHVRNDSRVGGLELSGFLVVILAGAHKLPLVVGAAVANYDLGGILVGHDHGGLGQARAEGVWVVGLQGLFQHSRVQGLALLVVLGRQGLSLGQFARGNVHGFGTAVIESKCNCLPVLLQDPATGGDLSVLENGGALGQLLVKDLVFLFELLLLSLLAGLLRLLLSL